MLKVRPAQKEDSDQILKILKARDLFYPSLLMEGFWVAAKDQKIIGALQLTEYKDFFFLVSLAIEETEEGQGVATALLKEALKSQPKNIYLYTIIPDFFKKFGFKAVAPPASLPSKERYGCEDCRSEKCVCMVKFPDAS